MFFFLGLVVLVVIGFKSDESINNFGLDLFLDISDVPHHGAEDHTNYNYRKTGVELLVRFLSGLSLDL